jgi:hypothetical protein
MTNNEIQDRVWIDRERVVHDEDPTTVNDICRAGPWEYVRADKVAKMVHALEHIAGLSDVGEYLPTKANFNRIRAIAREALGENK